jgi:GNAT superfamily N-acetyltransferase
MTDLNLEIRPAQLPNDYPAIAAIIAATDPDFRPTPEELAQDDPSNDSSLRFVRFIAEHVGADGTRTVIGLSSVGHDRWNPRDGVFIINVRVLPEHQKRGIGSRLYQRILDHLEPMNPTELKTHAREDFTDAVRFLARRGFVEVWRRFESKLQTSGFDFSAYDHLEAHIAAHGVRIVTYPELAHDSERDQKLHALDNALFEDIPLGEEYTPSTLERWRADHIEANRVLHDAFFVAVKGDEYVGMSTLWKDARRLLTAMTGVKRGHRGFGLATALKLRGIRYAQAHGNLEMTTMNDAPNAAMIGINEKLGFVRSPAWLRYAKTLPEAQTENP